MNVVCATFRRLDNHPLREAHRSRRNPMKLYRRSPSHLALMRLVSSFGHFCSKLLSFLSCGSPWDNVGCLPGSVRQPRDPFWIGHRSPRPFGGRPSGMPTSSTDAWAPMNTVETMLQVGNMDFRTSSVNQERCLFGSASLSWQVRSKDGRIIKGNGRVAPASRAIYIPGRWKSYKGT